MSERDDKKRLKQSMMILRFKLEKLKPHIETSERLNALYNRMLIEKAMLKNELDGGKKRGWGGIFRFFKPRAKKLISDYFRA